LKRRRRPHGSLLVIACALSAGVPIASAQDAILDATEAPAERSWFPLGDFWTGYDHVSGLPNGRGDVSRLRARLRAGILWNVTPDWELGGSVHLMQGTDSNSDNRRNNDNERSDDVGLDQLFARWRHGENTRVTVGKTPLPLDLSPMLWDPDIRPAGVSIDHSIPLAQFSRLELVAGYFAGQHLYGDTSRIATAEMAWRIREGAPTHAVLILSFVDFEDLGELTRQGLARTNTVVAGRLVNDYRLLDLQMAGHVELAHWPVEARVDLVDNLGADESNQGARASLVAGDRTRPRAWEFGCAIQRIQRDAVMAAFNSDDWWFHSAMRGQLAWIGYGIDATWNVRLAGFHERRDGLHEYTDRVRLDLTATW
jgi:hypothetical protein